MSPHTPGLPPRISAAVAARRITCPRCGFGPIDPVKVKKCAACFWRIR